MYVYVIMYYISCIIVCVIVCVIVEKVSSGHYMKKTIHKQYFQMSIIIIVIIRGKDRRKEGGMEVFIYYILYLYLVYHLE